MSVSLDPEVEAKVQWKVKEGLHGDANTVVLKALELLDRQDKLERLRALIREGEEGESVPWTPELMEQLSREADEMIRKGIEPNPDVCP